MRLADVLTAADGRGIDRGSRVKLPLQVADAIGDKAAGAILECLRNGEFPRDCLVVPAYRIGGTFR